MYRDNAYYAPNIEIIEVKVEQGICSTGGDSNTPGGSWGSDGNDDI